MKNWHCGQNMSLTSIDRVVIQNIPNSSEPKLSLVNHKIQSQKKKKSTRAKVMKETMNYSKYYQKFKTCTQPIPLS